MPLFSFLFFLLYNLNDLMAVNSTVTDVLYIPSNPVLSGCDFCQSHVVCMCVYGLGLCTVTGDQQVCDC